MSALQFQDCLGCGTPHTFPDSHCLGCWTHRTQGEAPFLSLAFRYQVNLPFRFHFLLDLLQRLPHLPYTTLHSDLSNSIIKVRAQLRKEALSLVVSGDKERQYDVKRLVRDGVSKQANDRKKRFQRLVDELLTRQRDVCGICGDPSPSGHYALEAMCPVPFSHARDNSTGARLQFWHLMAAAGLAAVVCARCATVKTACEQRGLLTWRGVRAGLYPFIHPTRDVPQRGSGPLLRVDGTPTQEEGKEIVDSQDKLNYFAGMLPAMATRFIRRCEHPYGTFCIGYTAPLATYEFGCERCIPKARLVGYLNGVLMPAPKYRAVSPENQPGAGATTTRKHEKQRNVPRASSVRRLGQPAGDSPDAQSGEAIRSASVQQSTDALGNTAATPESPTREPGEPTNGDLTAPTTTTETKD